MSYNIPTLNYNAGAREVPVGSSSGRTYGRDYDSQQGSRIGSAGEKYPNPNQGSGIGSAGETYP
ncbi:hypothetical protein OESDEN_16485, partial [Oesophagostomum dentatum]